MPEPVVVLLEPRTRRVLLEQRADAAQRWLLPPGSTLKPFTMLALLETRKLHASERFFCPSALEIAGRSFTCSHPPIGVPMEVATAIAYSCNCFVAHFAQRFAPGELAHFLDRLQFEVTPAVSVEDRQMQALGETRVLVTPEALARAYAGLVVSLVPGAILQGLEGAVEYGTAQLARVPNVKVAGKTGSALTAGGAHVAWCAAFAPSRNAQVVAVAAVQGRSGGQDAAPVAGHFLAAHLRAHS